MKRAFLLAVVLASAIGAGCSSSSSASLDDDAGGPGEGDSGTTPGDEGGGGTGSTDGGTGGPSDAGTIAPSSAVSIIVEPNGNHASELVAAVQAATKSVYVTLYQLDNKAFLAALEGKSKAGVDVKVVLDGSSTNKTFNTPAYDALNAIHAGSAVWSNPSFTYTHEKCVIIDGAQAWIMTMNLDQSSPDTDREYLAIDTQAADVMEATAVFQADFAHTSITPTGGLVVANTNARAALVALIGTATKSLDLELEEFSDMTKNGIVDALTAAAKKGVKVRLVLANNTPPTDQPAAIAQVKAAGASVVQYGGTSSSSTTSNPYVAAKTILVDCSTGTCTSGYVGSENMTASSLSYNRELGVIFDSGAELAKISTTLNGDFAKGTAQ